MSVTIESLEVFCDVVREKSFSRGAEIHRISQSSASQMISQLEKRLGVQLIDRSTRPLTLTPQGEIYYDGCRELIEQYSRIEAKTRALHQAVRSKVNVACIYSMVLYDMNRYVRAFQEQFPQGQVRLQYLHPDKVYECVLGGEVDLGLVSFPRSTRELEVIPWQEEPMVLVCHPSHRLAEQRSVELEQIEGEDFVAFDRELVIRREVDRCLRQHRVQVRVVIEFDNIEAIKRGIEMGAGVALLPEPTIEVERARGTLRAVALEGTPLVRPLGLILRRGRVLTPAARSFIGLLGGGMQPAASASRAIDLPALNRPQPAEGTGPNKGLEKRRG